MDPAEANEPMLANEPRDAALPIDKTESWEQMESNEFSDQSDHTPAGYRRPTVRSPVDRAAGELATGAVTHLRGHSMTGWPRSGVPTRH
jgi:hypothetical protein